MVTRLPILFLLTVCLIPYGRAQSIAASDGEIHFLIPGNSYTLRHASNPDSNVTPLVSGLEWGRPMQFVVTAHPGSILRVQFDLPSSFGGCVDSLPCNFLSDALFWEERDVSLNPRVPQKLTVDSSGRITLDLGVSLTIPPYIAWDLFRTSVRCTMENTQSGWSGSAFAAMNAYMYSAEGIPEIIGDLGSLSRGITYSIDPASAGNPVTPVVNGHERGTIPRIQIKAHAGTPVGIRFTLPAGLQSDDGEGSLPCRFAPNALLVEESGKRLDPNIADTFQTGPHCSVTLDLGISVTVPLRAVIGSYTGQVIYQTYIIGGRSGSEAELLYTAGVSSLDIPQDFKLLQNFPNPFNSSTTITFELPVPAVVSLTLYDLLGRRIATLDRGPRFAGMHSVNWDAGEVPGGVYICRLEAGTYSQTRKLLLLR